ncbi:Protein kinase domain-containing protein [Cinnamomum micranthum f. kanehirae]|uniref:Receptor-like serine/threonine-protein kinase n=1 Tax=Cinnamomum micranthum f. kanehirae TaxID=337451 RepID=A0A3S3N895_9MAGN|nr:Protein kinase domain-containing protein [Cinnamomum micranthum f. kanehirae]
MLNSLCSFTHEMAPITWVVFLFAFAIVARSQPTLSPDIRLDSRLYPTRNPTSWRSRSGHFAFGFYQEGQGFAVGIWLLDGSADKTVVWTANTDDPLVSANATLVLTKDDILVSTAEGSPTKSISGGRLYELIHSASMLDNGNFVLYGSDSKIIWQSFKNPTDTILAGQSLILYQGDDLLSSSVSGTNHTIGRFRLTLDRDYGLTLAPAVTIDDDSSSYWISSYSYHDEDFFSFNLDDNGHMYVARENHTVSFNLTVGWPSSRDTLLIYRATLDPDGIFRLYSHSMRKNNNSTAEFKWESLQDECSVYGSCGINSYCTLGEPIISCTCVPGFNYINSSERSAGCEMRWDNRSFGSFEVVSLSNTWFKSDYYSFLWNMEKEDCKEACSTDANCVAALYDYSRTRCYKLKFPLRYGQRGTDKSISSVLFVKLANRDSARGKHTSSISKTSIMILVIGAILTICSGITMAVFGYLISRRGLWAPVKSCEDKLGTTEDIVLRSFSYNELAVATNGFDQVLGRGSFGTVYKGALSNNERTVAVKRLEKVVEEGEREFQMEMRAIGRTHHRNLVRLIGFCNEGFNRLLVYEYMKNGSLADFIFSAEGRPLWSDRVRIILEVDRGILYLHEDCEPHIIHCDIKPQNILIDEFWTAKISDFGLAKLLTPNQTRTFTGPRGTRGYLAPEWYQNKPISVKADIYSFGIVLLEIVCCRRNIELEVEDDEIILTDWISKCYRAGELAKLFHGEEVEKKQFERIVMVGLWCIQSEPAFRPSMKNVILMIEGIIDVQVPPFPAS